MRRERRRVPPASNVPLVILAGFPAPTAHLQSAVENLRPGIRRVVTLPSGHDNHTLYRASLTLQMMQTVCEFARRRLTQEEGTIPTPSRILLIYVGSPDSESLLRAFDYCVFPIRLESDEWPNHRHWRFDPKTSRDQVFSALKWADDPTKDAWAVRLRIESSSAVEPLVLPPANFMVTGEESIGQIYRAIRTGGRPWDDAFGEIKRRKFDHAMMPDYHLRQSKKMFCEDARDVVFPPAKETELHGGGYAFESEHPTLNECQSLLRELYRFGSGLKRGFHHCAQRERGEDFGNRIFHCREKGAVHIAGGHANIYPDDFIRAGTRPA